MQTSLVDSFKHTDTGKKADEILRRCVHCGFCNATCPTYQITGDELDGPRGRIYLIKQILEGQQPGKQTRLHLDRCLQCRACETTCPSGVRYSALLQVGQKALNKKLKRKILNRWLRNLLGYVLPRPGLFKLLLILGRVFRILLPGKLGKKIPRIQFPGPVPQATDLMQNVILLDGCVQRSATPATNAAAIRVLTQLGIRVDRVPEVECCAAIPAHLDNRRKAQAMIKKNIDAWWPLISEHTVAILSTASGCGLMIAEYENYLNNDPGYLEKVKKIAELNTDLSSLLASEDVNEIITPLRKSKYISYHAPCTQQHGLGINGVVESILTEAGYKLTTIKDGHLCCGSAGTYSITQPALSRTLLKNKVQSLTTSQPDIIATANVGCQLHLQTATNIPVVHWIELIDSVLEN